MHPESAQSIFQSARILFVDDEEAIISALRRAVRKMGCQCDFALSGQAALTLMADQPYDLVVSDMRMPEMNGAELLSQVASRYPDTIRMVLSGQADKDTIMQAINEGRIWGFIHKPWDIQELILQLKQALTTQQAIAERALLKLSLANFEREFKQGFMDFVGRSMAMQLVYNQIERAAPSQASVFITGPSGTGKEVAAQALHDLSPRRDAPFIALNCAAIPSELMESEIFGHVKGAFSGAVNAREGAAHQANGGTLFLDELAEMDILLQAKLLRFIQTGMVQKVGGQKSEKVDIRFICATNRPPLEAIEQQQLREDLYYRLNVVSIHMPPLSDRDQDKLELAEHFLNEYSRLEQKAFVGFTQEARSLILSYDWPGNVRQLKNCIHNMVIMNEGPLIHTPQLQQSLQLSDHDLAAVVQAPQRDVSALSGAGQTSTNGVILPLADVERHAIEQAIELCGGNVVKAASQLKVSPSTLYRKIQNWAN